MSKTRKRGWSKPGTHERTLMMKRCGKKCFLGPNKSFPICSKNTCKVNKKGVLAAYKRARQWKHKQISSRAFNMLHS